MFRGLFMFGKQVFSPPDQKKKMHFQAKVHFQQPNQ